METLKKDELTNILTHASNQIIDNKKIVIESMKGNPEYLVFASD